MTWKLTWVLFTSQKLLIMTGTLWHKHGITLKQSFLEGSENDALTVEHKCKEWGKKRKVERENSATLLILLWFVDRFSYCVEVDGKKTGLVKQNANYIQKSKICMHWKWSEKNAKYIWFVVKELIANILVWSINVKHLCHEQLLSPLNSECIERKIWLGRSTP